MKSVFAFVIAVVVVAPVATACAVDSAEARSGRDDGRIVVVATTTQLADFSRIVGGDAVDVYDVLKANVDAHDYEPSPRDLDAIADAAVVVENGVGLEGWFDDTIAAASPRGRVLDASSGIALRRDGGHDDPHVWQSPLNAVVMVQNIAGALIDADPGRRDGYQRRRDAYVTQLRALDAEIAAQIAGLPEKHLVTNHDAFGYYVDRYGLTYVGSIVPSFDSSAELSARDVADLVAKIRSTGTKAVFSERSLPPRTAEAIGREAGVRVVAGDDALYGDSLGPPGSDGDNYLAMMRHNTKAIVDNLR